MACIALCVKEASKSTFSPLSQASRDSAGGLCSSCWTSESQPSASGELSRPNPLPPASKTCIATWGGWPAWQRPSGTNFWSSVGLEGGQIGGGGLQNVSPSPFYTPLLFGTELPKADGCADSLQIRADLRSSQWSNQKQLSSSRLTEGLCCPLLVPQESAGGNFFYLFN